MDLQLTSEECRKARASSFGDLAAVGKLVERRRAHVLLAKKDVHVLVPCALDKGPKLWSFLANEGFGERTFDTPPALEAAPKGHHRNSNITRPVGEDSRLPMEGELAVVSCVPLLLFRGRPSTILRRVSLFVVTSIQRVFRRWSPTDVFQKLLETTPSRAHVDAPGTVVLVARAVGVGATLVHRFPRLVLGGDAVTRGFPVSKVMHVAGDTHSDTVARNEGV